MAISTRQMYYQEPVRSFVRPSIIQRVMTYSVTDSYWERQMADRSPEYYERQLMDKIHQSRIYQELMFNGVFLRIVHQENVAEMTRSVELVGYFTPVQLEQYEKNRMMDKLAGRYNSHEPVNYKI